MFIFLLFQVVYAFNCEKLESDPFYVHGIGLNSIVLNMTDDLPVDRYLQLLVHNYCDQDFTAIVDTNNGSISWTFRESTFGQLPLGNYCQFDLTIIGDGDKYDCRMQVWGINICYTDHGSNISEIVGIISGAVFCMLCVLSIIYKHVRERRSRRQFILDDIFDR